MKREWGDWIFVSRITGEIVESREEAITRYMDDGEEFDLYDCRGLAGKVVGVWLRIS